MQDLVDIELEKLVLATLFVLPKEELADISLELEAPDFGSSLTRSIFVVAEEMANQHGLLEPGIMAAVLRTKNPQADDEENLLWEVVELSKHATVTGKQSCFNYLKRYSLLRKINDATYKLQTLDTKDDCDILIQKADNYLTSAISADAPSLVKKVGAEDFDSRIRELIEHPVETYGIHTGLSFFDLSLDGICKSLLYLVGGRPGAGKSALAQNLYHNISVQQQIPMLVIDTETSLAFTENRILSIASGIDFAHIIHGKVSYEQLEPHIESIRNSPLYYYYMPNLNISKLKAICKKYQKAHGIEAVFVDFLGSAEVAGSAEGSAEIGKKIKDMHDIATTLDLGFVVFQQLNRKQLDDVSGKSTKGIDLGHFAISDSSTWYADAAIGLRFPTTVERAKYNCNRLIDIPKSRFGKAGISWPLNFEEDGSMRFTSVEKF
jgi:replicative DNA helicase